MTQTKTTASLGGQVGIGRGAVTRISAVRRTSIPTERAREARRTLKPRTERFAHLKRMHD